MIEGLGRWAFDVRRVPAKFSRSAPTAGVSFATAFLSPFIPSISSAGAVSTTSQVKLVPSPNKTP